MNVIQAYLKKAGLILLTAVVLCCATTSCDNAIYDDEGDCSVTYRVAFRYDRNMKWADAFAHEVKSVRLYAFDTNGTLVWQRSERGEALKADGYAMTLDLPAGDYRLVAWCGLDNDDSENGESFTVPQVRIGQTRIEELQCQLNRQHDQDGAYSDKRLHPLFHGMLDVSLPASDDGGDYTYTMSLTKDTNHVRIMLQHLSGKNLKAGDFIFRIEEENGLMGYDNGLLPDEPITYRTYNVKSDFADLGRPDDYPELGKSKSGIASPSPKGIISASVVIADLSIARLMDGRQTWLTIKTQDGHTSASIPLTDYALKLMDGYDEEFDGNQDYLDRQDEYSLVFFLDENRDWIGTSIIINSWRVVINDIDFGK